MPGGSFAEGCVVPYHLEVRSRVGTAWASWSYYSMVFPIPGLTLQSMFHYNIETCSFELVEPALPSQAWLVPRASPTVE